MTQANKITRSVKWSVLPILLLLAAIALWEPHAIRESSTAEDPNETPSEQPVDLKKRQVSPEVPDGRSIRKSDTAQDRLYDGTASAKEIYEELETLADAGDGRAALRILDIDFRCAFSGSSPKYREDSMESLGSLLSEDKDGRMHFNVSLAIPGTEIWDFEQFADYVRADQEFCDGFTREITAPDRWLDLLITAADAGYANAQIALWSMPKPSSYGDESGQTQHLIASRNYSEAQNEIDWQETKLAYLEQASNSGDPRAWVMLGDAYSGQNQWIAKDQARAYAYYYMASTQLDYPFIQESLSAIASQLNDEDERRAQEVIGELLERTRGVGL